MSTLPYLDIHTHRRENYPGSVNVSCLSVDELISELSPSQYTCAGIHPWWLEDYTFDEISGFKSHIENLVQNKKLWAIGETGLDRAYPEFFDQQKELFDWHLNLAEQNNLPMVIHSVRSGADFLELIKKSRPTTPWMFHDFRGNEPLMKDLLRLHPKSYFSFGISVDNSPQVRELLTSAELGHLFFETDDQKHLDIHEIHLRAAHFLDMDVEFLKSQIWLNFKKICQ